MEADFSRMWDKIRNQLKEKGIEVDTICCDSKVGPSMKVVCVAPGMEDCLEEMGQETRDKVVMVRLDETTTKTLDKWVEAGVVRSRSEAAALFIREGLKLRSKELEKLDEALHDVEKARARLRDQAREVLGRDPTP